MKNYKILEEKNVIDDHLLDIIGNEFKFDHEKGLAEWIKNSVDAYNRQLVPDNNKHIILRFTDNNGSMFECVDFVGMTSVDIDKALKRWGDPEAAKRGMIKKTYGGHGNGGKFYMRQMFEKSYFITYKNGLLNIFGFNQNKKYGFADNFKDKKISISEALKIAEIENLSPQKIQGFTVVKGFKPKGIIKQIKVSKICDKLKKHPQSMRIMERMQISVIYNGDEIFENLKPEEIKPLKNFEIPVVVDIPEKVAYDNGHEKEDIILANKKFENGKIILKTSEIALSSNSKYSDLNRIDIIGEIGVIASYQLREFGLYYPQTDFIYGECSCPILEDSDDDCVSNDRVRLIAGPKTDALLNLIKQSIQNLCETIASQEKKEKENENKKISSDFNNFLDKWKNRFMNKILGEVLIGQNDGPGSGFGENGLSGGRRDGDGGSDNENKKGPGDDSGGGNENKAKNSHFPRVLLSGHDDDPLNLGNTVSLQSSQGLIYQRPQDVKEGIYWINTTSPLANYIIDRYGAESVRWRDYLFQRYVEIFIKEALMRLEKREPDRFNANTIDGEIFGKLVTKIHEVASKELNSFLFDESYSIKND
jgi:hypothetical protein